jgi:hypothetical protein
MIMEEKHAIHVQIFRQEKTFQDHFARGKRLGAEMRK